MNWGGIKRPNIQTKRTRSCSNVTSVTGDGEVLVNLKYISAFILERNYSNVLFVIKDSLLRDIWLNIKQFTLEINLTHAKNACAHFIINLIWWAIISPSIWKTILRKSCSNVIPVTRDGQLLVSLQNINAFILARNHSNAHIVIKDSLVRVMWQNIQ